MSGDHPLCYGVLRLKAVLLCGSWLGSAGGSEVMAVAGEQQSNALDSRDRLITTQLPHLEFGSVIRASKL